MTKNWYLLTPRRYILYFCSMRRATKPQSQLSWDRGDYCDSRWHCSSSKEEGNQRNGLCQIIVRFSVGGAVNPHGRELRGAIVTDNCGSRIGVPVALSIFPDGPEEICTVSDTLTQSVIWNQGYFILLNHETCFGLDLSLDGEVSYPFFIHCLILWIHYWFIHSYIIYSLPPPQSRPLTRQCSVDFIL